MSYRLQLSADWARKLSTQQLNKGGVKMMTDILKMARQNAPVLTGALRNSGRFQQLSTMKWRITFGNSRVPYARIREHTNRTRYATSSGLGTLPLAVLNHIST